MASKKAKDFLSYLIIFFEIAILITATFVLIFVAIPLLVKTVSSPKVSRTSQTEFFTSKAINVEQLYKNINSYAGEPLKVKGEVNFAPIVCQPMRCSKEDPCCGCPEKRDLMLVDKDKLLVSQRSEVKLLEKGKNYPLCERKTDSCNYICKGWEIGNLYLVKGVFVVEKPPRGTSLSRGYLTSYFEVEDRKKLGKSFINPGKLLNEIIEFINQNFKNHPQVRFH